MTRLLVGIIKGAVVAIAALLGLNQVGIMATWAAYAACIATGALVGLVAGKPPWKAETLWTPVIKSLTGGVVGFAICAAIMNILPNWNFLAFGETALTMHSPLAVVPLIALVYGAFVEVDDA